MTIRRTLGHAIAAGAPGHRAQRHHLPRHGHPHGAATYAMLTALDKHITAVSVLQRRPPARPARSAAERPG
jgi:hypothetical protein